MVPAINVEGLQVGYRGKSGKWVQAVHDLTFQVQPGEIVGFLGPNGAGKSSTLKALMGFVEPQAGRLEVFGHVGGSLEAKGVIGYLPEVAMYYPFLTPLETLVMYGELQGLRGKALRSEALELLALVGLEKAVSKQNRSLSKGMLQRVGIAQSLLGSPKLLVLDEVTSGLDPVGRKELRELLKDRQRQGATLFFSSHELSEVDMLCDRILLIHQGRLIEERKMDDLKEDLRNFVLVYRGGSSMLGLAENWNETAPNTYEARFADKPSLLKGLALVQSDRGEVLDIVSQEGSLEDYFIDTIGRAA